MRALKLVLPSKLSVEEVPDPVRGANELLVRVAACGICGTDLHGYLGHDPRRQAPLILGHEAAGVIVDGARRGQRVAINPIITCMECEACLGDRPQHCSDLQSISLPPREGAFADLVSVPERNLYPVPDAMPFATAALIEPTAVACHAVNRALSLVSRSPNQLAALVIGGGPIGLLSALVLKARGFGQIALIEPNESRRRHAEANELGPVLESRAGITPLTFDLAIDAVGSSDTRQAACEAVKRGGAVIHLGLMPGGVGLDAKLFTIREIIFTGSYCYTRSDFAEALDLLSDGRLGSLDWVGHRSMEEGPEAFEELARGAASFTKLILQN